MTRLIHPVRVVALAGIVAAGSAHPERPGAQEPAEHAIVRIEPGRARFLETMTPAEAAIIDRHFAYLVSLRDRGIVLHAGRTTDPARLWGVVLMRASAAEAAALMARDPAVTAGLQTVEVFPYRVAIERR